MGMINQVREEAPVEFGKLKFDQHYWPTTEGKINGLSILYDADIEES
jgi:hypothetical protein